MFKWNGNVYKLYKSQPLYIHHESKNTKEILIFSEKNTCVESVTVIVSVMEQNNQNNKHQDLKHKIVCCFRTTFVIINLLIL